VGTKEEDTLALKGIGAGTYANIQLEKKKTKAILRKGITMKPKRRKRCPRIKKGLGDRKRNELWYWYSDDESLCCVENFWKTCDGVY